MNLLNNFGSKQCERIRRQLDAYLSNELLVETISEVLRHLDGCEACSRELQARTQVREALRKAVLSEPAPEPLRLAIHHRLRKTQRGLFAGLRAPAWTLALASLVVIVAAGIATQQWLRVRKGGRMVAGILALGVSDHLQCAIQGHNYRDEGRPPDQLRQRLGPAYVGLLDVVEQRLPGFQVLEAHQCQVRGSPRRYVHFIASGQGEILSVILTKRDGQSLPGAKSLVADAADGINLYKAQLDGVNVAGFESNDYFGFVVSGLGQNEMLQLAAGLAPAIRNVLPASASARPRDSRFSLASIATLLRASPRTELTDAEPAGQIIEEEPGQSHSHHCEIASKIAD